MVATAYESGQIAGRMFLYVLLIAAAVALVRRLRRDGHGAGFWRSRAAAVLGLVLFAALALGSLATRGVMPEPAMTAPSTPAADELAVARIEMIAGCTDKGAPRRYCVCVTDEGLRRDARDTARLRAMEAEFRRVRPGSQPPAVLVRAAKACASLPPA